ncbi:MAG TPA: hypothetical protein VEK57_31255 [Thermoanaerobaculia bacterium]|nr:hypothetical protein [Thermoanaerobaculia bacterium]
MATFTDLQNGFYNKFSQALGLPEGSPFQLLQPSPPLVEGPTQDTALWNYFNNIPPYSLTQNFIVSGGNQFYSDYSGLMSALAGAQVNFEGDIGPKATEAWNAFVLTLPPTTTVGQFPLIFRNWALTHGFSSVAVKGASDLAAMLLDPISNAQLALMLYLPNGVQQVDFDANYQALLALLRVAPSRSFTINDVSSGSDVSKTWTGGSNSGFFGLWGGSSSEETESQQYASSKVDVAISFQHVLTFGANPGAWYNSSAAGLAFSVTDGGPPWVESSPIKWSNTFGAPNGNLQRFAASLIIVSGMKVTVTASTTFSTAQQTKIQNNSSGGLWPFYSGGSSSSSTTGSSFNDAGNMTTEISTLPDVPIVLGVNVISAAEFLGHSANGVAIHQEALARVAA